MSISCALLEYVILNVLDVEGLCPQLHQHVKYLPTYSPWSYGDKKQLLIFMKEQNERRKSIHADKLLKTGKSLQDDDDGFLKNSKDHGKVPFMHACIFDKH